MGVNTAVIAGNPLGAGMWERAGFVLAFASAAVILFSIAAANILLALAVSALLISGAKLRFPPIKLPLVLFFAGTIVSLALSQDPSAGRPQIRKFIVFLTLLVVFSAFRTATQARWLVLAWAGAASISALQSFAQVQDKLHHSRLQGRDFYEYYMMERTTGFMSHWMTFGSQQMYALLFLAAFLFWSPARGKRTWVWLGCGILIAASVLLGFTRSIWLATGVAGLYLLWRWNWKLLPVIPVLLVAAYFAGPQSLRDRFDSFYKPRGDTDSNQHRMVCWVTGVEMIKAKPLFGLGPEHVKLQFLEYVPESIPRPLPTGWYGHLHNIYIHYAAERGIPTMLMLVWLLGKVLWDFARALRRLPPGLSDRRALLEGGIAAMLATLVVGIFELNLGDSEVLMMFLSIVSIGYIAIREPEAADARA